MEAEIQRLNDAAAALGKQAREAGDRNWCYECKGLCTVDDEHGGCLDCGAEDVAVVYIVDQMQMSTLTQAIVKVVEAHEIEQLGAKL